MESSEGRYYFVSDVHLGAASGDPVARERRFVDFLKKVPEDTTALFLLGDIFDFWVEYREVVPRGFTRVFGQLARLSDAGCKLYFFKGNHDWWGTDYFEKEFGATVISEPYKMFRLNGLSICLGHGDIPGCSDFGAKLIFKVFRNKFLIRMLMAMPSAWTVPLARKWSGASRKTGGFGHQFDGCNTDIYRFVNSLGRTEDVDYYIFGHYHVPAAIDVESGGKLLLLGDWEKEEDYLYLSGMMISGRFFPNIHK